VLFIDEEGIKICESATDHTGFVYNFADILEFRAGNGAMKWICNGKKYKFGAEKGQDEEIQAEYLRVISLSKPPTLGIELIDGDVQGDSMKKSGGFFAKISPKNMRRRSKSREGAGGGGGGGDTTASSLLSSSGTISLRKEDVEDDEDASASTGDKKKKGTPSSLSPVIPSAKKSGKSRSPSPAPRIKEKVTDSKFEKLKDLED